MNKHAYNVTLITTSFSKFKGIQLKGIKKPVEVYSVTKLTKDQ